MENPLKALINKLGNKIDRTMEDLLTLVAMRGAIKARRIAIRSLASELIELDPEREPEYQTALEALKH